MKQRLDRLVLLLATGFSLGKLPFVPGTWGTLGGVVLYLILLPFSVWTYNLIIFIAFLVGCWICERAARIMGEYDHGSVVWDEIVGYCIAMMGAPRGDWRWMIAGFILFRVFDILKPWPIRQVDENMKSGFGMMLDDVLAGMVVAFMVYVLSI